MSPAARRAEPCNECEKVRIEQELIAAEAARASTRGLEKLEKEHELALDNAEDTAVTAIQQARLQADAQLGKLFHEGLTEIAKGAIERSRDSAKYVQTAAAAIAALYTGALGLVFSVTNNPLPVRGIAPTVFLGLSVALATAYLAYLTKPSQPPMYGGGSSLEELQLNRTAFLTRTVNAIINDRRYAIRASVLSLAIGVAFVPAAFVATHRASAITAAPVGPKIPGQVAAGFATDAQTAFNKELAEYEAAATARKKATTAAETSEKNAARDDRTANWVTLGIGALGLLIVFLGPLIP